MRTLILIFFFSCSCGAMEASTALDKKLKAAGIPVDGVSVKDSNDKATWRIDFQATATKAQKDQAAQILVAFDVATDAVDPKMEVQLLKEQIVELQAQVKKLDPTFESKVGMSSK